MSRVVVTGATGTIGRALVARLRERGDAVVALSRDVERARAALGVEAYDWPDPTGAPPPEAALTGADAVVHLLGEPVAQRWTETAKRAIRDSRVLSTRQLVSGLHGGALVSQSATGYYGVRGDEPLDEGAEPGSGFLAEVVIEWEREALAAAPAARVCVTRTGVVLARGGGALAKMLPPFRAGVGGPVAGGRQYIPWIHIDDVVGGLVWCVDNAQASGPVNLTAPEPVTNAELSHALGRVLHRPAVLPVPGFALRALYGEMAEIVTTGARVVPRRLTELGFRFQFTDVEAALRDVV